MPYPGRNRLLLSGKRTYPGGLSCYVQYDGALSAGDVDTADNDDLPAADFTAEGWFKPDSYGEGGFGRLWDKYSTPNGWRVSFEAGTQIFARARFAVTETQVLAAWLPIWGMWYHIAMTYTLADKKLRLWINGSLIGTGGASSGAYNTDATIDLGFGSTGAGGSSFHGGIGWQRFSNSVRYAAAFTPPTTLPVVDGNTVNIWKFDEGFGNTVYALINPDVTHNVILNNYEWVCV